MQTSDTQQAIYEFCRTVTFTLPTIDEVEFVLDVGEDYSDIRESLGLDCEGEDDIVKSILDKIESGNIWAWAFVALTAKWKGLEASDYLGGCSYDSEEAFKEDGYYQDMKETAYNALIKQLESLGDNPHLGDSSGNVIGSWIPIETYNLGPRIPILVHDPDWYDSRCPGANVAHAYLDEHEGWQINVFEGCSHYSWVNYLKDKFNPKFWMPNPLPLNKSLGDK